MACMAATMHSDSTSRAVAARLVRMATMLRKGFRKTERSTSLPQKGKRSHRPRSLSRRMRPPFSGAGGRMASAGFIRLARRAAWTVPATAKRTATPRAPASRPG